MTIMKRRCIEDVHGIVYDGERDTFAKNVAPFRRSDPLEESIDDRRDRPMIDRRWIEDLTLGLIRN